MVGFGAKIDVSNLKQIGLCHNLDGRRFLFSSSLLNIKKKQF